jgi:hypothetical protein
MNMFKNVINDLREKRLWPLAIVLLVALIAVPLLVSNSSSPSPRASIPPPAVPPAPGLPVVSAVAVPSHSHLTGRSRDPFSGSGTSTTVTATSTTTATSSTTNNTSSTTNTTSTTSSGSTSSSGTTAPQSTSAQPQSIVPPGTPAPKPVPPTLNVDEVYHVTLAITNSSGGLDTVDPLERLTVLPDDHHPLLVELGVLKGGHRVLFAVQPGAIVNGPATCTPGPIDCEILSLAPDQTEGLSVQSAGGTNSVALFAVTGISTDKLSSASAADQARKKESAAGRAVLNGSPLSALSLFRYEPSLGAVVDLRNLQVGG